MIESRPEECRAASGLVRSVRRLAVIAAERRADALAGHGLDDSQLEVLEVLHASGQPHRLTAGELAQRCRVTPGAVSQRLSVLERSGLVERVREEPDRRTVHVRLTAQGQAKLDQVAGDVVAADDSMVAGLGPADVKALESMLERWLRLEHERIQRSRRVDQDGRLRPISAIGNADNRHYVTSTSSARLD